MYKDRGLYSLYHQRIHVLQFEGFIILNIGKCEVGEKSINQSSESLYTHMVATTYFACYIFQFSIFTFCLLYISVPYFHILSVIYFSSVFSYFACYIFQFRIFTSPFQHVGFADFWLADQLNSLVIVLLDFEFMACFYAFEVDWLGPDREYSNRFLLSLFSAMDKSMNFKELVKCDFQFWSVFFCQ